MGGADELQQDRLDTRDYWKSLIDTQDTEELLNLTKTQISTANVRKLLTNKEERTIHDRQRGMKTAIRSESVTRYPVQIPKESAQETYSDKYEEKMSESKRTKKQNRLGTVLHRKKLNAEGVESAESKYQNEKSSQLAQFLNMVQTGYPTLLHGKSVDDLMSDPEISDRAEFLVYDDAHLFENLNVLFGEKFEADLGQECVRQFMELDLSADLRTDKKLVKDADRLEKVTAKVRAMINLVDRHPEIEESMEPREREEFEGKLDRAFALLDYYQLRKDVITDPYYRTHENSEISMRFERRTKDNVSTPSKEQRYLEQQNLTRKIWAAEYGAVKMGQYSSRSFWSFDPDSGDIRLGRRQEDTNGNATPWNEVLQRYYQDKKTQYEEEQAETRKSKKEGIVADLAPHTFDTKTVKGKYFSDHYKKSDPVYRAVTGTGGSRIAGTTDKVLDIDRGYVRFSEWRGLNALTDQEFTKMMENFTAFNQKVTDQTPAATVTDLKNKQLDALSTYKKVILAQTPYLKEKYGVGLLLETPQAVFELDNEIRKDIGNSQTITEAMKIFEKYGILNEKDPDDREMETVMWYMHSIFTAAYNTYSDIRTKVEAKEKLPSFTDMMRQYTVSYEDAIKCVPASLILRIRELERNPDMNTKVQWTAVPDFGS